MFRMLNYNHQFHESFVNRIEWHLIHIHLHQKYPFVSVSLICIKMHLFEPTNHWLPNSSTHSTPQPTHYISILKTSLSIIRIRTFPFPMEIFHQNIKKVPLETLIQQLTDSVTRLSAKASKLDSNPVYRRPKSPEALMPSYTCQDLIRAATCGPRRP